jgi:molybdopterin-guanine dinucleotide biosynthesis protein A
MIDTGQEPKITGIILAGGESRRMGTLKPLVVYRGKPLITWIYDVLSTLCGDMIIIANSGDFSHLAASVYPDNFPGNGPAAGIESGLSHCTSELALIASCDTPNLPAALFAHLLRNHNGFDISLASHDDIQETLIGVYSRSVHAVFREEILSCNPRPLQIIRKCNWHAVHVDSGQDFYRRDLFLNLNSPEDLIG